VGDVHRVRVQRDVVRAFRQDDLSHQLAATTQLEDVVVLHDELAIRRGSARLETNSVGRLAGIPVGPRQRDDVLRVGGTREEATHSATALPRRGGGAEQQEAVHVNVDLVVGVPVEAEIETNGYVGIRNPPV